jgi:phosphatidylglycerophosphatase A
MTKINNQSRSPHLQTRELWWWLATWFGSGLAPKASGTVGSIAALPFAYVIQKMGGLYALPVATLMVFFAGWWASNQYLKHSASRDDPKEIVVDEVAGIWLLLCALPHSWHGYLIGFVMFRFFDVLKPWPISVADREIKGGFGIMFDDILAAIYPVIILLLVQIFLPNFYFRYVH